MSPRSALRSSFSTVRWPKKSRQTRSRGTTVLPWYCAISRNSVGAVCGASDIDRSRVCSGLFRSARDANFADDCTHFQLIIRLKKIIATGRTRWSATARSSCAKRQAIDVLEPIFAVLAENFRLAIREAVTTDWKCQKSQAMSSLRAERP